MKQSFLTVVIVFLCSVTTAAQATLKAGAARVDITPIRLPVLVNGGMLSRSVENVSTRLYARAIVLDDGQQRLGIVVVDSCMMSRSLLDEAKQLAAQRTSILPDRMLISATHTHTAPASMGCLGTNADPTYVPYLREKLAEALAAAEANLELARVGWAVGNAAGFTALRRWIRRPDRIETDPFGNPLCAPICTLAATGTTLLASQDRKTPTSRSSRCKQRTDDRLPRWPIYPCTTFQAKRA